MNTGINLGSLTDNRLKGYKSSLYKERSRHFSICDCCREMTMINQEDYNLVGEEIRRVSIEQMSRAGDSQ